MACAGARVGRGGRDCLRTRLATLLALALFATGCGGGGGGESGAEWLTPHNQVRAGTFAGVTVSPAPSPPMPALTWSASAAAVAQAWADGCVYAHNAGRGSDGVARGENIAASSPGYWDVEGVVGAWASEWSNYTYSSNACASGKMCGHYTQVVWRSTQRVGCASKRCTTGSPFPSFPTWDFYVCDYEPPGNYGGQRPY